MTTVNLEEHREAKIKINKVKKISVRNKKYVFLSHILPWMIRVFVSFNYL